jgi:hypothetical protein
MPPDPKPPDARPVRIAVAPRPHEAAVQYQLSIDIVVAQPALDEKRVRQVVDVEFAKLAKTLANK